MQLRGWGFRPDFVVKLDFEIAVDQQTRAHDQTFEGVPDPGCPPVPCMQDTFTRATHSAYAAARPSARATIGYLVYKPVPAGQPRPYLVNFCQITLTWSQPCLGVLYL